MSPAGADALAGALDGARAVRPGEELDVGKLAAWLRERVPGLVEPLTALQFPAGHSNLTYLVADAAGRELVLRRPPFGNKVASAHDMGREYKVLSRLHPVFSAAPRPLALSAGPGEAGEPDVIGAPFYVMERIRGVVLRRAIPAGIELDAATVRRLSEAMIDKLAELHAVDYPAAGLGDFGLPEGYVQRQVSGWTKRYGAARTEDIPDVTRIADWLAERTPRIAAAAGPATVIHNDFKYDNVVLDPAELTRIIGVLDWEMATIGDPLMDLGTMLGYWIEGGDSDEMKLLAFGPTHLPGSLTRVGLAERYTERTGRAVGDLLFYYCFALFKTAVVLQQIYKRYHDGLTKDARFAGLIAPIRILARAAVTAADTGRV